MSARDLILQRLRQAGAGRHLPRAVSVSPAAIVPASVDASVERFAAEAASLGVECSVHATAEAVRERLAGLVRAHSVLSWHPSHLPYDAYQVLRHPTLGDAPRHAQASAEIGVTGCDMAIAETGSLVLFSGPGRSRAVSLLPPVHIALVRRHQVCMTMAEMFVAMSARWKESASCTVITGPSRTADIELTLTLGIHGPGRVAVLIGP